jgi:dTDP-4-amino-4,6-dideoxygalactose transaminase
MLDIHLRAKDTIKKSANRKFCVLTNRGSTALYVALKIIGLERGFGNVILPAIGCLSLPQTVLLSGHNVIFADIDPQTGCILAKDVQRILAEKKVSAIIPVHMYGHAADIKNITRIAENYNVQIIEDACHGLSGIADDKPIGSWGDFSIVSFGGTKTLGGLGGGALLFNNKVYIDASKNILSNIPAPPNNMQLELLALSHRNLYHGYVDFLRSNIGRIEGIGLSSFSESYRPLLIRPDLPNNDAFTAIIDTIGMTKKINSKRLMIAKAYEEIISKTACCFIPYKELSKTGTLWRYTFTTPEPFDAIRLTKLLREEKIHASNQYWSLSEIWNSSASHENSAWFQTRVINLWVDKNVNENYIAKTRDIIFRYFDINY